MTKQYEQRDIESLDEYMTHVIAMTAEQLHSKSDIAAELAWRDSQISELQQKLYAMAAENAALKDFQPTQQMITAAHRELEEYDNIQIDDDAVVFTWQAMRGQQKTPATDIYLNSVRADAVSYVADHIDSLQRNMLVSSNSLRDYAVMFRSGTHDTADKAG